MTADSIALLGCLILAMVVLAVCECLARGWKYVRRRFNRLDFHSADARWWSTNSTGESR